MTPEQKLKWAVLAKVAGWDKKPAPEYPCPNVDELYDALVEEDAHWDGKSEVRGGEVETGLKCDWSRHYESIAELQPRLLQINLQNCLIPYD